MFSLLIIQFFQTIQLYDRKSKEFKNSVHTVLERIAVHHEKALDVRRYLQVINKNFNGEYKELIKKEFKNLLSPTGSVQIKDTVLFQNGELNKYLLIEGKTFDSISGLSTEQKVLARDVRHFQQLFDNNSKSKIIQTNKIAYQLDQRIIQHIFKKAKYINEIMAQSFRENIFQKTEDRVDINFLDSVIRQEMIWSEFPHKYHYKICNERGQTLKFPITPDKYLSTIDTVKSAKAFLFPQNILDDKWSLFLKFDNENQYIFKEMGSMMIVNILLMVFILISIIFMFNTILSQKKLDELKNDFISNMTHEFKTPISTISLACEALNDIDVVGKIEANYIPFIKMISDENKRLGNLVENILQSSVLDKGELKLNKTEFDLVELCNELINSYKMKIDALNGQLITRLPHEKIMIFADRFQVSNLINNLMDNALKYSKKNIKITLCLEQSSAHICLSIIDEGIGISKEYLSKIFDKLFRVPTGNIHNVKGFGLGLNYVKSIIELHAWNIQVKSKLNSGSTFKILIPINK